MQFYCIFITYLLHFYCNFIAFLLQIYCNFIAFLLTQDEVEALEEDEKAVKKQYPSLGQFQEQIDFYENLHDNLKGTISYK